MRHFAAILSAVILTACSTPTPTPVGYRHDRFESFEEMDARNERNKQARLQAYVNAHPNEVYPIAMLDGYALRQDAFGGNEVLVVFFNTGDKPIKYVDFRVLFINRAGDVLVCPLTGESDGTVRFTGPLEPGKWGSTISKAVNYADGVTGMRITSVSIRYMDGTTDLVFGQDLAWLPKVP